MPLDPHTLLGPYEVLSLLGAGGMGEVYRGRDTRLGRAVAIKIVHAQFSARFENEARVVATLNHPNICTVYDVGTSPSGFAYLVMELVEGETLSALLRKGPLAMDQALRVAAAIAEGLESAHAANIVHRDLKPGNVMITPESRVKLLDFGLAKLVENTDPDVTRTVEGAVMGTFAYMSPEQVQGKPADARSDIFSFGLMLHEMLTGQRAFQGDSAPTIAASVLRDEPTLASVPAPMAQVVARCLRKKPEDRYQRIAEVKADIDRIAKAGEVAPAGPAASIAVLPFANMSGDKDNEYFSDGLAEEILNALTRVEGLKVTARTSAFAFRGKDLDIRKIGEALGVRTVLEGSMRRSGNRIRVTAQLINVADGYHLWSERYDRDMTDVFAVQDEMSAAIVAALKLKLAPAKLTRGPANIEAYHALLKARQMMFSHDGYEPGVAYAEEAIALDAGYALAHATRAAGLVGMAQFGKSPVRETMQIARTAALKALELDETLPEAHAVLAIIASVLDQDWTEALRRYRHSRIEDPVIGGTAILMVLLPLRLFDEAISFLEKAVARDPLASLPRSVLAMAVAAAGNRGKAEQEMHLLVNLQEKDFTGYFGLGTLYTIQGRTQEAIEVLEKGLKVAPWFPPLWGLLAGNYQLAGNRVKAEATLSLPQMASMTGHPIIDMSRALYHIVISEFDLAADYLEKAVEARQFGTLAVAWTPFYERFRGTPRGQALLAKMSLAPSAVSTG